MDGIIAYIHINVLISAWRYQWLTLMNSGQHLYFKTKISHVSRLNKGHVSRLNKGHVSRLNKGHVSRLNKGAMCHVSIRVLDFCFAILINGIVSQSEYFPKYSIATSNIFRFH